MLSSSPEDSITSGSSTSPHLLSNSREFSVTVMKSLHSRSPCRTPLFEVGNCTFNLKGYEFISSLSYFGWTGRGEWDELFGREWREWSSGTRICPRSRSGSTPGSRVGWRNPNLEPVSDRDTKLVALSLPSREELRRMPKQLPWPRFRDSRSRWRNRNCTTPIWLVKTKEKTGEVLQLCWHNGKVGGTSEMMNNSF